MGSSPPPETAAPAAAHPARSGMLGALAHRNFLFLFAGQVVSLVGDGFYTVALAWQAYDLSSSPGALASVLVARSVPQVGLLLVGGAVVDRFSRRTVMLLADAGRGVIVGVVALLALSGHIAIWHLVVAGAGFGVANAFFYPASSAIRPQLLPRDLLMGGNALWQMGRLFSVSLIGPMLGGVVVAAAGAGAAFAVDAGTFAVSALFLAAIPAGKAVRSAPSSVIPEIRDGLRFVRGTRWIWVALLLAGSWNLVASGPISVVIPLIVREDFIAGPGALGLMYAAAGLGGGAASFALGQIAPQRHLIRAAYVSWFVASVALAGIGLAPSVALAVPLFLFVGGGITAGQLHWETALQREVPASLIGRVASLDWLVSMGLQPLSYALAAPVAIALGGQATVLLAGLLGAAGTIVALLTPRSREPQPESDDGAVAAASEPEGAPSPQAPDRAAAVETPPRAAASHAIGPVEDPVGESMIAGTPGG